MPIQEARDAVVGLLGVGHLAKSILHGLVKAGHPPEKLLLAPRGLAHELGPRFGVDVARDNADLVRRCDLVLLTVRPDDAVAALSGLPWRAGQVIASACAGVAIDRLRRAAPSAQIVRIMPLTAVEIGASPIALFPDQPLAHALLAPLGSVIPVASEELFEIASVSGAIYGWVQDLIAHSASWSQRHGLPPAAARELAARTFAAAGHLVAEHPDPMPALLRNLATPGGITERGLAVLREHEFPGIWSTACDAVLAKLTQP